MNRQDLRNQYHNEIGKKRINIHGKSNIDYVKWLEDKIIRSEDLKWESETCPNCGCTTYRKLMTGKWYCWYCNYIGN